ncbi:MAG: tRNA-intron lyase [Candidatus Diapherotrites archaeon]|nr:tRNA-intron lyase [Candidatus Diapherotrites archaeon]
MTKKGVSDAGILANNRVLVLDRRKADQLLTAGFGERKERELVLDNREALYLVEKGRLEVEGKEGIGLTFGELLKAFSREKHFYTIYMVFKDLRERGFVARTGFKFGFDLRVYPRGKKPGEAHSDFVVHVQKQEERCSFPELSRLARMAGTLHTRLLLAVVDAENDVNYYQIARVLP